MIIYKIWYEITIKFFLKTSISGLCHRLLTSPLKTHWNLLLVPKRNVKDRLFQKEYRVVIWDSDLAPYLCGSDLFLSSKCGSCELFSGCTLQTRVLNKVSLHHQGFPIVVGGMGMGTPSILQYFLKPPTKTDAPHGAPPLPSQHKNEALPIWKRTTPIEKWSPLPGNHS